MVARSFNRGHETYFDCNTMSWRYKHSHKYVKDTDDLKCPRCGKKAIEDVDFCLYPLHECDFIEAACCGHGVKKGYIKLKDGRIFREENNGGDTE